MILQIGEKQILPKNSGYNMRTSISLTIDLGAPIKDGDLSLHLAFHFSSIANSLKLAKNTNIFSNEKSRY